MIFVSLGSQKFQFNRLLIALDELTENGTIKEEIFAQVGYSDYVPKHYRFTKFLNPDEFSAAIEEASVIITHAGTGVIIKSVKMGKKVIVVPRKGQYGEHVDDHQIQIAEMFSNLGYICACEDCSQIPEKLEEVRNLSFAPYISNTERYITEIDKYIQLNV